MKYIKRLNKLFFLLSLSFSLYLLFFSLPLPKGEDVISYAKDLSPVIEPIEREPFSKNYDEVNYKFTPLYSYEAYGVIVEHYDSDNWLDVVHREDPSQTKDICIVWGENIKSDIYRKMKYSHGEFTCFVKAKTREQWQKFHQNGLTNNHLIPANKELEKRLKQTKIGDQVYIKGELVNYEIFDENGNKIRWRNTSNSMDDRDCEVVYVQEYDIIKTQHPLIRNANEIAFSILGLSTFLGVILFFFA